MANSVLQFGSRAKKGLLSEAERAARKAFDTGKRELADRIRQDGRLTGGAKVVGAELASLVNVDRGYAWAAQDYLAEKLGIDLSTVKRAVSLLEKAGYFCVHVLGKRAALGETKLIYYPIFEPGLENGTGQNALCQNAHTGQKRHRHRAKETSDTGQNVPPISLEISLGLPPGGTAGAPDGAGFPPSDRLDGFAERLERQLGKDRFKDWVGKAAFVAEDGDLLTLAAPTKFIANGIKSRDEASVLAIWQTERPQIRKLDVIVAAVPSITDAISADARWLVDVGISVVAERLYATRAAADKLVTGWLVRCGNDASGLRGILEEAATQHPRGNQFRDFVKRRTKALLRADQPSFLFRPVPVSSADSVGLSLDSLEEADALFDDVP
jgi:hypothetical protein